MLENCEGSISSTPEDKEFKETIKRARKKFPNTNGSRYALQNYEEELWEWRIQQT